MTLGKRGLVVSGHRDLAEGDEAVLHKSVIEFLGYRDFDYVMLGGARGVDTLWLGSALEQRGTASSPKLVVVVPDTLAAQPRETWAVSERADRVIELGHRITPDDQYRALRHRNMFMVDWVMADGHLVALWNGKKSGTANAVHYARECGLDVSVRAIRGREGG